MKITNISKAPQGVHTTEGLKFIEPGQTRDLDVAEGYVERVKSLPKLLQIASGPLDHDGNGEDGGSIDDLDQMKVPELKAAAEAEGVDLMGATKRDDIIAAIRLHREQKASEGEAA